MPENCKERFLRFNGVEVPLPSVPQFVAQTATHYWGRRFQKALHRADFRTVLPRSLSRIARFGGNLEYHISVADHSLLTALLAPPELGPAALLHDAAEVFTNDVPSPIKNFCPDLKDIDRKLSAEIYAYFAFLGGRSSLPSLKPAEVLNPIIHTVDKAAYEIERLACDPKYTPRPDYMSVRVHSLVCMVEKWVRSKNYAKESELRYRLALEAVLLGIPFEKVQMAFWCHEDFLPAYLKDWPIETSPEKLRSLVGQHRSPHQSPQGDTPERIRWYQFVSPWLLDAHQRLSKFRAEVLVPTLAEYWEWLRGIRLRSPLFLQSQP